jgi:hypothetical protein
MELTLSQHVERLEARIVILKQELRGDLSAYQRTELELALTNAEEALKLFLRAFELERKAIAG